MELLSVPKGQRKRKRIRGRGGASGAGNRCGKGNKGQNCRSGGGVRLGFEGGQMPLYRRTARRGFSNSRFKNHYSVLNLDVLDRCFSDGDTVSAESLCTQGLVSRKNSPVKILGNGRIAKKLTVVADKVSKGAALKIEKAGGTVRVTTPTAKAAPEKKAKDHPDEAATAASDEGETEA